MKVAVIGSRGLWVERLEDYLPEGVTEIVSGGARGVDTCAKNYALTHGLKLTEFLPEYSKYGRGAPLRRTWINCCSSKQLRSAAQWRVPQNNCMSHSLHSAATSSAWRQSVVLRYLIG